MIRQLLKKEICLASSPLTYFFLAASLITLLPGYPILLGAFFMCLGMFHSFQNARENNDVQFTVLLPVPKQAFVTGKYLFVAGVQTAGFLLITLFTVLRMTVFSDAAAYVENPLMNPGPVFLAFVLLVFAAFNTLFIGGFFKTAYKLGVPFLLFGVAAFLLIAAAESLHHLPGLSFLNTAHGERLGVQFAVLAAGVIVYAGLTVLSCRISQRRFDRTDL